MKKAFLLVLPLLLIGAAIPVASHFMTGTGRKLELGKTYEVWLQEAEVSPIDRNGEQWDADGSAPDLRGMMSWQNQVVLKTVEASDGLIARWGETAVNASQALKGEADSHSLQRVGRFRMDSEGLIELAIFDGDVGLAEFAGGFRIPLSSLRLGNNRVHGIGALKAIAFRVLESDPAGKGEESGEEWKLTEGVQELNELPLSMKSASEGPLGAARKVLNQFTEEMSNELKTQGEVLSGEIEKGVNEIMQETASEGPLGGAGKALNQFAEEMSTELKKQGEVLGEEIEKGVNEIMQDLQTK
jgi:hypothetical protein